MFIAHLPAGYLLTHWLQEKLRMRKFLWIGLAASVFPDSDMLYFYLVDHRQTLHHHYWTHLPLVWLSLWLVFTIGAIVMERRSVLVPSTIFFANIILHFILDTFAGGINWLYPLVDKDVFLFVVPATHTFWIWSFIFHWTFLVEIAITIWAFVVFFRDHKKPATSILQEQKF